MKSRLSLLLLTPVLAFASSCGGSGTITISKTEFQALQLSNISPRYGQTGINFDFSDSLYFQPADKSQYAVDNTATIKQASFDISLITSYELYFRTWNESYYTAGDEFISGYCCGIEIKASSFLPDDGTLVIECVSKLNKNGSTTAECKADITFTIYNWDF